VGPRNAGRATVSLTGIVGGGEQGCVKYAEYGMLVIFFKGG
jgi:hypothetical protein